MNQSTTQLGSKRQSQGKHPYPTINISICCCVVIIRPVSIYFYVSCLVSFFPFLWFLHKFIFLYYFCFFNCSFFHQDGFLACGHLALPVSLFEVFVMLKVYCMSSLPGDIQYITYCGYSSAWTFSGILRCRCCQFICLTSFSPRWPAANHLYQQRKSRSTDLKANTNPGCFTLRQRDDFCTR